jgi:MoCo/4Fe-4S cofactor protein with predicted Tat translocation signal
MSSITASPRPQSPQSGRTYWRSLEQLQETPEFQEFLHREFPVAASEFPDGVSRRRWLQLMGASFALSGMTGCWKAEKIYEFVQRPANRIPGVPQKFASSYELGGFVYPLVVTCFDGRPVKVEGNKEHPLSLGATDLFAQALPLQMYDPDRARGVRARDGRGWIDRTWDGALEVLAGALKSAETNDGAGLRVLAEASSSPTRTRLQQQWQAKFPASKWITYEPISRDHVIAGSELAFGRPVRAHYDLSQSKIIVSLDSDLFGAHPAKLKHTRQWAARRDPAAGEMNRTYVVESVYTSIGSSADHRLAVKASQVASVLEDLEALVDRGLGGEVIAQPASTALMDQFLAAAAADLVANPGHSVIAVGPRQPAEVHARAHRLNSKLGNLGKTVLLTEETAGLTGLAGLQQLTADLTAGLVDTLVVLGGNPAYASPTGLNVAEAIRRARLSVHLTEAENETTAACGWLLPNAHPFESWGDGRTHDGTYTLRQPMIAPLFDGKSDLEFLSLLMGGSADGQEIVRTTASTLLPADRAEKNWRKLVHDGFWPGAAAPVSVAVKADLSLSAAAEPSADDLELVLCSSPAVYDGRFANNGWLQETPDLLTKITWDNAAILAPKTADQLGVRHGSVLKVSVGDASLDLPVFVLPGHPIGSIAVALGYGRTVAGKIGGQVSEGIAPVGKNAYAFLSAAGGAVITKGVTAKAAGGSYVLATTQDHHAIDTVGMQEIQGRIGELVREASLATYTAHPDFAQHMVHHPPLESLWPEKPSDEGRAWGMAIDLSKCIGCNACLVACQSENNVPIVGREQIRRGREMHWIRVDRYFRGNVDEPEVVTQPVTCHHCENAPCEQVCPVAATAHSPEGLNDMAYNRCVGTRYCANNCPFKVRRFNFFDFNKKYEQANTELQQMMLNPEVTVRERGVMEKCTYCIQRIAAVRITAKNEQRGIRDGEIVTACQEACPAGAISFGDLNDQQSQVRADHANPRAYAMLAELNIKPRTKYLARIRNPHPWLAKPETHVHHGGHGHDDHGHTGDHGHDDHGAQAHGEHADHAGGEGHGKADDHVPAAKPETPQK